MTIRLLYAEVDYDTTITRAVMAAFDIDCNGATCGSRWGANHRLDTFPTKWTEPLRDRVRTGVHEYRDVVTSKLAADMAAVAISSA